MFNFDYVENYFQQTIVSWNKVFYVAAGMYAFGSLVFVVFGRTSVQKWNNHWEHEKEETKPLLGKKSSKADVEMYSLDAERQ